MLGKVAFVAILPLTILIGVPAHADPGYAVDPGANYDVFLKSIAGDGIVMDTHRALLDAHEVCTRMRPPNSDSLWDAGQHLLSVHPDWRVGSALSFADRAAQDICPNNGSF